MDHAALRTQLPALVGPFLPRNVRSFNYRIYDDQPAVSAMGFVIDPQPFEGKVVAKTDHAIIVQIARAQFAVIDRHLASHDPEQGAKVAVTPYARHHFDGMRLDAPRRGNTPNSGRPDVHHPIGHPRRVDDQATCSKTAMS